MACGIMCARQAAVKRGWAIRRAGFWNPADAADFVVLGEGMGSKGSGAVLG